MNNKGLSLLEVLIAITIFVVGVLVIVEIISMSMLTGLDAQKAKIALSLAQEQMEQVKEADTYDDIDTFVLAKSALPAPFTDYSRSVTVAAGDPKSVTVTVYWNSFTDEQYVGITSLLADYDY